MNVLLDEQIDVRMRETLYPWPVGTLFEKGWNGKKNGELRELLNVEGYTHFITADKNMPFQQNLLKMQFVLVVIDTPTLLWEHQRQFAPRLHEVLAQDEVSDELRLVHVSVPGLSRGKRIEELRNLFSARQIRFV